MKKNKKIEFFLKKYFYTVRFFVILLGTLIMFHAYYFYDRPFSVETLINDIGKIRIYLCLLFSFGISLLISYVIGFFNKENIEKIKEL